MQAAALLPLSDTAWNEIEMIGVMGAWVPARRTAIIIGLVRPMMIVEGLELPQEAISVVFVPDDDVIQQLALEYLVEALDIGILPWTPETGVEDSNAHRRQGPL